MIYLYKWLRGLLQRAPWTPLQFPKKGFHIFDDTAFLEEERLSDFARGVYYPMTLGEVLLDRYQVAGKLGFGRSSTVWLARDMHAREHVALKVYTRGENHGSELKVHQTIQQANKKHPGAEYVRSMIDTMLIPRSGGDHQCLIQQPLWDSLHDLRRRRDTPCFTEELLKLTLVQIFHALDFLHTECRLVHTGKPPTRPFLCFGKRSLTILTDIKGGNIHLAIKDQTILEQFIQDELDYPCPRKYNDNGTIYASRPFGFPKDFGQLVLSDLGEAVNGDELRHHIAQPDVHRSPEVMLKADWSYAVDIWNVGTMVWDLFEGKRLFQGRDPDGKSYTTRAHLSEIIAVLGPPPLELIECGRRGSEFFDEDGNFSPSIPIVETSLEESEERLSGKNKKAFLRFMRKMLQWRPEDRATARELLEDPWLCSQEAS